MTESDACADALRAIQARDFRSWGGLPPTCTPERIAGVFPREGGSEGRRHLGSVEASFWPARALEYKEPLEIHVAGGRVVRIDAVRPDLSGGLAAHLAALGEPAAKRRYYDDVIKIDDGEWVWPERGIAIYLNPDHRFVNRIALFRATDLPTYQRELELNLRVYEEP
jgi:hypothetical protein